MSLLTNAKYFFNYYVLGYRYNVNLDEYFDKPYNKSILQLFKEGYNVSKEFDRLFEEYDSLYKLNYEELSFFNKARSKNSTSADIKRERRYYINKFNNMISEMKNFLFFDQNKLIQFNLESQIIALKSYSNVLSKENKKISPIVCAVFVRKLSKCLLEKLIAKHINIINTKNYEPQIELLKKYSARLKYLNLESLLQSVEFIINGIKISQSRNKGYNSGIKIEKKDNPIIVYSINNDISKVIETLLRLKNNCNHIIHFNDASGKIRFKITENIFDNSKSDNSLSFSDDNNKIINDGDQYSSGSFKFKVTKVIQYIAYGNISNDLLEKLQALLEKTKSKINNVINETKSNLLENCLDYESAKSNFEYAKKTINKYIEEEIFPDFIKKLINEKIPNIKFYIDNNPLKLDSIPSDIPDLYENEKKIIEVINDHIRAMDIYSRIKFNLTFSQNLELLELKKKADILETSIKNHDAISGKFTEIKEDFYKEKALIDKDIQKMETSLITFDRSLLFTEIKPDEFVNILNDDFMNDDSEIDLLGKEVNNFYLYIYLLKRNLYNEEAYKSTSGINNDYI